ncbi:uncharacterized protein LOC143262071 [Megalopta genalis]|uniref:uncharacterized protein LOC143262071 n=1 Tax=Megalopta genalis TaxID=115081 RepID=UPI003FD2ADE5
MECSRTNTESCIEWGSIEGGEIEFESLTEDTLEGALQVIRKSFFPNESICKAVNLISAPCSVRALEELCVEIAKDGVSIVAVDVKTGEVVGVVLNKIKILRDHPMPRDPVTNPRRPCGRPPFRRHRPVLWRPCQKSWLERFKDNCAIIGLLKLVILLILTAFLFSLAAVTRLMELTVIVMYPVPIFVLRLFSRVVVSTCIKANLTF